VLEKAARSGTASGLNDALMAAAAFALLGLPVLGAIAGFAFGADRAMQSPTRPASDEPTTQGQTADQPTVTIS
jgi:hypothetical protein